MKKSTGVVAFSGGNFAQAVAYAGSALGIKTRILMPEGTPINYLEATRTCGAESSLSPIPDTASTDTVLLQDFVMG